MPRSRPAGESGRFRWGRWGRMVAMPGLVDSHCHLDAVEFDPDREAVIERARAAGVGRIVVPAVSARGWDSLQALCGRHAGLQPAYGLHPMYLAEHRAEHLDALRARLNAAPAIAVGECGLDHYVDGLDRAAQLFLFEAQLRIAREFDLPVILHARRAVDAVLASLRRIGGLRGVVHSFSGSIEQANQLHRLGFLIGIGGPLTYARARRLRRVAACVPLEQLLLESDAPDQPPASRAGARNEPASLVEVFSTLVTLRRELPDAVALATTRNADALFRLSLS